MRELGPQLSTVIGWAWGKRLMSTRRTGITFAGMATIRITLDSSLPTSRVLFGGYDFSERRFAVWPAVRADHFVVHSRGDTTADVTEGTPAGIGTNWERCDYDWSTPGVVVATVTDSNVYAVPGSVWQMTATERHGGSRVELTWFRKFRRTPRGILFGTAFRTVGRLLFAKYARDVIANLEQLDAAGPREPRLEPQA